MATINTTNYQPQNLNAYGITGDTFVICHTGEQGTTDARQQMIKLSDLAAHSIAIQKFTERIDALEQEVRKLKQEKSK